MLFNLKEIGGKKWYEWGADTIVKNQRPDGSWRDRFPGICDTCFALLFLKRANVAKDLTDKLQEARVLGGAIVPPRPHRSPCPRPRSRDRGTRENTARPRRASEGNRAVVARSPDLSLWHSRCGTVS